jgi:hypothetical protein
MKKKHVGNAPPPAPAGNPQQKWLWLATGLVVLAAAAIRIYGAFNDMWLDEIWSWEVARQVSSPLDVFTKLHHEINHYLNTLYLWAVGDHGNWVGYRIPSIIAGSATVALAGLIGSRRNFTSAMMAVMVTGFSYALILYSSEARGYATAIFFSFLCYYTLARYLENRRWPWAALFSTAAMLGLVSHLTFASVLFAAMTWSGWRLWKSRAGFKPALIHVASCYAAPVLLLAALYWVDIRFVKVGGGTETSLVRSYVDALAWMFGTQSTAACQSLTCLAAVAVLGLGVRRLWREKSDAFVFFIGVTLVFPLGLVVIRGSHVIYFRHFIVGLSFLLILFSFILADLFDQARPQRAASLALLAVYLLTNGWLLMSFFEHGRGHYHDAVRFLAENSRKSVVTVGSDSDVRVGTVVVFYAQDVMGGKTCRYCTSQQWPPGGPEWVIASKESFEDPTPPGARYTDNAGNQYDLVKIFQTAPLSGLHWFIYHNQAE